MRQTRKRRSQWGEMEDHDGVLDAPNTSQGQKITRRTELA